MRGSLFIALLLLAAAPARAAEEPSGCDKFKWNIDRERAALSAPDRVKLASGGELAALPSTGMTLGLSAPAEAKHAEQKRQERAGIECGEDDDFTAQARDPGREGPPQSLLEEIIALPKYLETAVAFTTPARTRVYKEATVTVATRENVSELVQLG